MYFCLQILKLIQHLCDKHSKWVADEKLLKIMERLAEEEFLQNSQLIIESESRTFDPAQFVHFKVSHFFNEKFENI
jgi:hypothetical protein